MTSPPYFGLRDYQMDGQIGQEPTPSDFVTAMVEVFRDVWRVLRDDGTLRLNLGDSYNAHGRKGHGSRTGYKQGTNRASLTGLDQCRPTDADLKEKELIGIPWRVAFALQADGWYLRQDIIWSKPNPMPESVRDRCTKAHEYIFMLTKSPRYYYDIDAMKEPAVKGASGSTFHTGKTAKHQLDRASKKDRKQDALQKSTYTGFNDRYVPVEMRNKRSVWTVSTKPFKGAHFATYPPDLVEPCILAGCPAGGTVLDPFFGAGTTGLVAQRHGRNFIGCELNAEYAEIARARIAAEAPADDLEDLLGTLPPPSPWAHLPADVAGLL